MRLRIFLVFATSLTSGCAFAQDTGSASKLKMKVSEPAPSDYVGRIALRNGATLNLETERKPPGVRARC
jgi:hypothetical protein